MIVEPLVPNIVLDVEFFRRTGLRHTKNLKGFRLGRLVGGR